MYSINSKSASDRKKRNWFSSLLPLISNGNQKKLEEVINLIQKSNSQDQFYKRILDFIPNLVCAKDINGVYVMVNQAFEDFAGKPASEIIGKTDIELGLYLNAQQVMEADSALMQVKQRKFIPLEPFTSAYGDLFWFQTMKSPSHNEKGEVDGLVIASIDITKKVDVEQKLTKSELRYRSIFENNYSGIIAIDKDLMILNKNRAFDQLVSSKHIEGSRGDLKKYLKEEDRIELLALVNGLSTRNYEFFDIDIPLIGSEGSVKDTICFVRGLYDDTNQFTEAVVTFQDVTFEKKQKRELEESELRFRTLVENAPEAIMLLDLDSGLYIDANDAAVSMLGFDKQTLFNEEMDILIWKAEDGSNNSELLFDYMKRALNNESVVFDWKAKCSDGRLVDSEVRLVKMPYPNRTIIRISILDISERKQAENLLSNEKMKLQQSNRELIDLNYKLGNQTRQLQEFAYIASHNLRAPAGNIRALLDYYHSDPSEEALEILLEKMDVVAKDLLDTIDDLAQVVKIKNEISKETTEIDMPKLIDKALESLSQTISSLKANVNVNYNGHKVIFGPKSYWDSIFLNFITNALKYSSEERSPVVNIEFRKLEQRFEIEFKDNGLGIDLKRFGHKLFGLRKTFHRHKDSRGVGLFITKAQVEAMGGDIKVESEVGVGTTFIVKLPLTVLNRPE